MINNYEMKNNKRALVWVIIIFLLSRVFFFWLGVRFNTAPLIEAWQYIDTKLMKENLFESLYYLHSQPPFFNLFLGIIVKMFPNFETVVFHLIYVILGLLLAVSMFLIMVRMGVSNLLSAILTILFTTGPACILNENLLHYDYPVSVLLCLSMFLLQKFVHGCKLRDYSLFVMVLSCIVLMRSFFHIVWFVLCMSIVLIYQRQKFKRMLFISTIAFMVVFSVYIKNFYLFGNFGSSSWLGLSLAKLTVRRIPPDQAILMVKQNKISPLALIPPFSRLSKFKPFVAKPKHTNIPVLDQETKSSGAGNYNNLAYINISKIYLKDAFYIIKHHSHFYLQTLGKSFFRYFTPATLFPIFWDNIIPMFPTYTCYNATFYRPVVTCIIFFTAVFYGCSVIFRNLVTKYSDWSFGILIGFMWLNILYVTSVGNFLEFGENNRFRFLIEPFLTIMLGVVLDRILTKISAKG